MVREGGTRAPGRLIAVVGLDGAGKSTQVPALGEWLTSVGVPTQVQVSVSMSPVRKALSVIAAEDGYADHLELIGAETMRLISACNKLARVAPVARSLRESGGVVVMDRYTYCQYALASAQRAGDVRFLRRLFAGTPKPDLTLFLDVEPEEAARRVDERGVDVESVQFLKEFREAYQALPEFADFVRVDGNGTPEEVQECLRTSVRVNLPELFS